MPETKELKVRKRDGRIEDFMRDKVAASVRKAGASPEVAESIGIQVESWAGDAATEGVIKSSEIRTKVLELLRPLNPKAATAYETYKKPV